MSNTSTSGWANAVVATTQLAFIPSSGRLTVGNTTQNTVITPNNFILAGVLTANSSNGTSGQVLTSSGASGNVYWSTVSGGGGGGGATLTANNTDTQTFYFPMSNTTSGSWSNAVVTTTLSFTPSTGTITSGGSIIPNLGLVQVLAQGWALP